MKGPRFILFALLSANWALSVHVPFLQKLVPSQLALEEPHTSPSSDPRKLLLSLHRSLCEISSITGNEANVTRWLASYLSSHNLTVELQEVSNPEYSELPPRHNILAYLGKKRQTRTLLTSHLDVVPPFWPYELRNNDTEIWGRGSVDAKGGVASQIAAFASLLEAGEIKEGDVALLFVVGEETAGDGMVAANDLGIKWETVVFAEPTELKLACGHKGMSRVKISAKGKAGHSGYPELGRSANDMLIKVLGELLKVQWPKSKKYGNTTANIGKIEGGVAGNVIAEEAYADVTIRIAAGGPEETEKLVRKAVKMSGQDVKLEFGKGYAPVPIDCDIKGFGTIVVNYGTDVPNLKGDHKRYLYGPGDILVAHSDHEHLKVVDLETAVDGYKKLIKASLKYLGGFEGKK